MSKPSYRGRFAPSPTGPLHFGSLVAAVASYADARHQHGEWLVRIEDVDQTRTRSGAEERILQAIEAFGMSIDGTLVRQSERTALYDQALDTLRGNSLAYPCDCSRKTIAAIARVGREGPIYPGTCRLRPPTNAIDVAWRVALDESTVQFTDRIIGDLQQHLASDVGDFVVRRIDRFTAYQLAVVVDDFEQGITDVVRGADLLWSTPRQIWLQRQLGYPTPNYAHVPLVYAANGQKLSKSDAAHPVDEDNSLPALLAAWQHLGQTGPTVRLRNGNDFWTWAIENWRLTSVPVDRKHIDD